MSYLMKIVVVGDEGVGKRSLINKIIYPRDSKNTVTIDAHWASVGFIALLHEKQIGRYLMKFQMWILNPLEMKEIYCYGALGAIVVFDITNRQSVNNVQKWIKLVWKHNGKGVIPVTIVGTKNDLRKSNLETISNKQGKEIAAKLNKKSVPKGFEIHYRETSIYNWRREGEKILQELGQSYLDFISKTMA